MDEHRRVKFNLIDKVEQLSPQRIVAVKHVSLAEEYLADHFPTFPVLPGVMMLEAAVQAASWLLHTRRNFARSMAVLKEAKNVKYGHFVAPGNFLRVDVELTEATERGGTFKVTGSVGSATAIAARLELAYFDLSETNTEFAEIDRKLREHNRARWSLIAPTNAPAGGMPATVPLA